MKKLSIIKVGGNLINDELKFDQAIKSFSLLPGPKILVHGGGSMASSLCQTLGIEPIVKEGRRVTDLNTLEIVTMVYAGLINKKIVSRLQKYDCNAIGFSGADGNMIQSVKRPVTKIDYGFVGDIDCINSDLLIRLLEEKITPVFCAITHDGQGQLLNTNADTIASTMAKELSTHYDIELKYCFEKDGVLVNPLDDDSMMAELGYTTYLEYRQHGIISDGMIPKLDNAFSAKKDGVSKVVVCGINGIVSNKGTIICE